jgi:hypothetical protein
MSKRRTFSSGAALFVSALLVAGALLFSACTDGGNGAPPAAPAKPGVTAGTEQLTVTWTAVENAEYYEVYYGTNETGDKTKWGESHTATTVTITGLTGDTLYYVWVKAWNADGGSDFSPFATGTPVRPTQPPAAPALPTVTAGNATLTVTWTAVDGASSYEIYYAADTTAPTAETTAITDNVTITVLTATITGLTNGAEYSVYVRARNSVGPSAWSAVAKGTPVLPVPAKPAITVTPGNKQLTVAWAAVTDAESYEVYFAADTTAPAADTPASKTGITVLTDTITDLTNGTAYSVYVRATNAAGKSEWSAVASATPVVGTPANITVFPENTQELTVSWDTVTDATSYDVYYNTTGTAPTGDTPVSVSVTALTTTLSSLTNGTVYYVWVRAKDSASPGAYSVPVAGAPYNPSVLTDLAGPWVSSWGEEYKIENREFISAWGGYPSYKGTIVHIRQDDDTGAAGYLTIRYTENANLSNAVGNYYVIRWEGLASNATISFSGGFNSAAAEGFATLAEAEAGYTGTIGGTYFAYGSDCYFTSVDSQASAIQGSWTDGGGAYSLDYTITDKLVIFGIGGYSIFVGEIVNVRDPDNGTGYITFKYITNGGGGSVGDYCVLYWKDYTDDPTKSAQIAVAYSGSQGDEGKTTKMEAETTYTIENSDAGDDWFYDIDNEGPWAPPSSP